MTNFARLLTLLLLLLAGLSFGCDDSTAKREDTAADSGKETAAGDTRTEVTTPDANDADTAAETSGCTAAETRCIGEDKRAVCGADGRVKLENCGVNEVCFAAACAPVVCERGKVDRCIEGGQYEGCNPMGTGTGTFNCLPGMTCSDGACIARLCAVDERDCQDDNQVLVCNQDGTAFVPSSRCSDTDLKTVCDKGECKPICEVAVKTASYVGCEYWAVDLDNAIDGPYDAAGQPFAVVVSNATSDLPAQVKVFMRDGYAATPQVPILEVEVLPGELQILTLPPHCYDGITCPEAYAVNGTVITPAAYRIDSDIPITAYQFNPLDNVEVFSNDASLLLPKTSLGRRYLVMTRMQQHDSLRGFMTIVGTEPVETTVTVKVTGLTLAGVDAQGNAIPAMQAGESRTFKLEQFEVLNILTNEVGSDLTGSEVVADERVVVFGGSEAANAPETDPVTCCADHLEQQLYPVNTWGLHYHAAKSFDRNGERELWRVMARMDGTTVTTTPPQPGTPKVLGAGEWFEMLTRNDFFIDADRPILVGQFLASEWDPIDPVRGVPTNEAAGTGDPAFILGVPREQYRSDYVFLAPNQYEFDYLTVIAPIAGTVTLDTVLLEESVFKAFGDGSFKVAKLPIADGVHHLTASAPVGLFVYGYDSYVSYGYPAGLDLEDLFQ